MFLPALILDGKRVYRSPDLCTGTIPTEIGQLTALYNLYLYSNELTGKPLTAHKSQLVNESTIDMIDVQETFRRISNG